MNSIPAHGRSGSCRARRTVHGVPTAGVETFRPETGAPFNRREARAVRSTDVSDPARAETVAEMPRPGCRLGERVLRYAEVVVWKHVEM